MKKLFVITTALTLFLVACNSDNSSEQKENQNKTETKSKKENSSNKTNSEDNTQTNLKAKDKVENLPDKTKLALIFCADDKG
ncbi:hypothetical protein WL244_13990, partial [Staphylococcus ureilyticus]